MSINRNHPDIADKYIKLDKDAWKRWINGHKNAWVSEDNSENLTEMTKAERTDLLVIMAKAAAMGNPNIRFIGDKAIPSWYQNDSVYARLPDIRPLSGLMVVAIREISKFIDEKTARDLHEKYIVARRDEFVAYMDSLFLEGWAAYLSQRLGIDKRSVQRWISGEHRIPTEAIAYVHEPYFVKDALAEMKSKLAWHQEQANVAIGKIAAAETLLDGITVKKP